MNVPQYLTVKQAAQALNCSTKTVRAMIAQGKLQFIQIGSGARKHLRVRLPEPEESKSSVVKRKKEYVGKILEKR